MLQFSLEHSACMVQGVLLKKVKKKNLNKKTKVIELNCKYKNGEIIPFA